MPKLEMPMIAPVHLDEKGRISCNQVTETMQTGMTVDTNHSLHVVMATLCHIQCDSKAS